MKRQAIKTESKRELIEPVLIVHGGAGDIPQSREEGKLNGVKVAARCGYRQLIKTGNAMDAVEKAVRSMEIDEYFNAGYGSVLTNEGNVEMDASVMCGKTMKFGCVSILTDILHPITVSRKIMDKSRDKFLGGQGAMKFARSQGIRVLYPTGQLVTDFTSSFMKTFLNDRHNKSSTLNEPKTNGKYKIKEARGEVGTVGAVAIDKYGNIAVATSTGGISGKMPGRIGDTPIIGAGTYCDNNYAGCSATGHGETLMRACIAHDVIKRMEYLGQDVQTASVSACKYMVDVFHGTGGVITIDKKGNVGHAFTANRMAWAYQKSSKIYYGIRSNEEMSEDVLDDDEESSSDEEYSSPLNK